MHHCEVNCVQEVQEQAIAVCAEVAAHEQAFWQMAYAA